MGSFDLKTPASLSNWKRTGLWSLGALLVAGSIIGGAAYLKSKKANEQKPVPRVVIQQGFDPDFFAPPLSASSAPEAEVVSVKAIQEVPELINPRQGTSAAEHTSKEQPRPTARELFKPLPPTAPALSQAEEINASRRGSGVLRVWMDGTGKEAPKPPSTKDWGESKSVATFPMDMSRVIPVTRRISAVLVEAIHSELEGKITAQIEENIYGGHGRKILIPAGSMAVGRYKPLAKAGDTRIAAFWTRIITPDGININLPNGEMADAMGRSGLTGDVDSRFFDRYGMALLVSTLSAVSAYQVPVQNQGQAIVVQTFGNNLSQLSGQILEKNINIKPVVTVPAGARILISPTKDVWFKDFDDRAVDVIALDNNNGNGRSK